MKYTKPIFDYEDIKSILPKVSLLVFLKKELKRQKCNITEKSIDIIFGMAYEYEHSCGQHAVFMEFDDILGSVIQILNCELDNH